MGEKLNIICWKWKNTIPPSTRNAGPFTARHVNVLYNMLQRNLHMEHQLICVTDDMEGINPAVECAPMIEDFSELGGCYRRLKLFDPNINGLFGNRFVCIDLDVVIVDDVTPIFSRQEDFIIWGEDERKTPYCGSLWMMASGSRKQVWNRWSRNPKNSALSAKQKFKVGSDQSFISFCLYPNEETWTKEDGVYNFKLDVKKPDAKLQAIIDKTKTPKRKRKTVELRGRRITLADYKIIIRNAPTGVLPDNARMVFFNGKFDPSQQREKYPWVKDHWR